MATISFDEKRVEEMNRKAREETERVTGEHEPSPEEIKRMAARDLKDSTRAVGPDGHVDETHAPRDPTIETRDNPGGNGGTTPPPRGNSGERPGEPVPPGKNTPLVSKDEFKGKAKSFLSPDVDKGLWDTLDKKIDEALRGNTPEEVAQNMTFAALTFLFDLIGNWADHHRKEAKRLKKEYEEALKVYDKDMGVRNIHHNLAFWAVIADHPAMRQYQNRPVDAEMRRAALDLVKTDKNVQKTFIQIIDAMPSREHDKGEYDKFIKNALNAETGSHSLKDIQGMALDHDIIRNAASRTDTLKEGRDLHAQKMEQSRREEELRQRRMIMEAIREERRGDRSSDTRTERTDSRGR